MAAALITLETSAAATKTLLDFNSRTVDCRCNSVVVAVVAFVVAFVARVDFTRRRTFPTQTRTDVLLAFMLMFLRNMFLRLFVRLLGQIWIWLALHQN